MKSASAKSDQFLEEALKMHTLPPHPNICTFLGVCLEPVRFTFFFSIYFCHNTLQTQLEKVAIVTEYYELGSLDRLLYKQKNFKLSVITNFIFLFCQWKLIFLIIYKSKVTFVRRVLICTAKGCAHLHKHGSKYELLFEN